jgi:hypothetical protein
MKDLYNESYKIWLTEMKENPRKWKDILCLWIQRIKVVKISIFLKVILGFNVKPFKITNFMKIKNSKVHTEQ